jgi:hypothetical protein
MTSTLLALVVGALSAAAAWVATNFVGKPIREFFDLKKQSLEILMACANVPARARPVVRLAADRGVLSGSTYTTESDGRLEKAEEALRACGNKFHAFAQTEVLAVFVLRRLGYRPAEAAANFIGLSNSIRQYGSHRDHFRRQIERSLKCRI